MLGSPILDVAIGMVFIYLLLSLIVSAIQEILASFIQARSANLKRGLASLFSGDCFHSATPLVELIYKHGLVRGLYQDPKTDYGFGKLEPRLTNMYREFTGKIRLAARLLAGAAPPGADFNTDELLLPSYIPARTFALALSDVLNDPKPHGWDSLKNMEANLTGVIQTYPDNKAVQALLALVRDAGTEPAKLQANLENWYNDSMDRVSGWYKRYVQKILIIIGFLIAVAFNVDSIRIARTLWVDKDMRAGLASAASEYWEKHKTLDVADINKTQSLTELQSNLQSSVKAFDKVGRDAMLPVGWKAAPWSHLHDPNIAARGSLSLAGWLITAIALSLGAPFWFDMLNKIMVIRSTVKPQEKSQIEKSKD